MNLPAPAPELRCDFTPAFYGDRIFQSFFCGARHALKAATGVLAVGSTLPVEFVVHGVLFGDRNIWQMLQRYQGHVPRSRAVLCDDRPVRDHSTDIAMCDLILTATRSWTGSLTFRRSTERVTLGPRRFRKERLASPSWRTRSET